MLNNSCLAAASFMLKWVQITGHGGSSFISAENAVKASAPAGNLTPKIASLSVDLCCLKDSNLLSVVQRYVFEKKLHSLWQPWLYRIKQHTLLLMERLDETNVTLLLTKELKNSCCQITLTVPWRLFRCLKLFKKTLTNIDVYLHCIFIMQLNNYSSKLETPQTDTKSLSTPAPLLWLAWSWSWWWSFLIIKILMTDCLL